MISDIVIHFAFGIFFGDHLLHLLSLIDPQWAAVHLTIAVGTVITTKLSNSQFSKLSFWNEWVSK